MRKIYAMMLIQSAMLAGAAHAGTATTNFAVTSTLLATCSATANTLAFGTYTPGAGALTANSTVTVKCTKNSPYTVALNGGNTAGGTVAQRLMAFGANTLQYNLFTSAALTTVFGDGSGTSKTEAGTGSGIATGTAFTVFGQLPDNAANQLAVPGGYSDTVTVTISY